jgi:hypothetical protein
MARALRTAAEFALGLLLARHGACLHCAAASREEAIAVSL